MEPATSWKIGRNTDEVWAEPRSRGYQDLKTRALAVGRSSDQIVILPGISSTIGSTETEASIIAQDLNELSEPSVGLARLSNRFGGFDFSRLPLDGVLSPDDFPDPKTVQAAQSRAVSIVDLVRRKRPTLRALLNGLAGARGHFATSGTPEQIAAIVGVWFMTGAADGFNVMPPILPDQFDVFVGEVFDPARSGLFQTGYEGSTLREHLGLARPESQYFGKPEFRAKVS